jgi:hypothetical protein
MRTVDWLALLQWGAGCLVLSIACRVAPVGVVGADSAWNPARARAAAAGGVAGHWRIQQDGFLVVSGIFMFMLPVVLRSV